MFMMHGTCDLRYIPEMVSVSIVSMTSTIPGTGELLISCITSNLLISEFMLFPYRETKGKTWAETKTGTRRTKTRSRARRTRTGSTRTRRTKTGRTRTRKNNTKHLYKNNIYELLKNNVRVC